MNQILFIKNNTKPSNNKKEKNTSKKYIFKAQLIGSIILFFITIGIYIFNLQKRNFKEKISKQITNNYSILRLYNNNSNSTNTIYNENGQSFTVIGMIEIPKIHIYYPIISESNDELLKISPCRISGPMPNENGNLCIAGHNYDNYKFFSNLVNLKKEDTIIIYDANGNKLSYKIYDIYEVSENDLSPLEDTQTEKKQVTLVTCNNFNSSNRIIVKALYN